MGNGQITHIEFPADSTDRAQAFYKGLFAWEFQGWEGAPGYFLISAGAADSTGGAIGQRGVATGNKVRVYVTVDSLDETLPKVPGLGGKVVTPKTEIPTQGWYAVVEDSEGSEIGLYENLPAPAM